MQDIVESSTKISFNGSYAPENEKPLSLGSVGVRKRWMFNVYAFGLYFDPENARSELKRWNTYNMEELVSNLSFYNAICVANFEKGLLMKFARSVKGSDLQLAFEESLKPHIDRFTKVFVRGHNKQNQE